MRTPSPALRRFLVVIGAPACLALTAACTSTSSPGSNSSSPSAGATASGANSTPSTQAGSGDGATASSSAAGGRGATPGPGTSTCTTADLQGGLGQGGVAAGSTYVPITFKNVGNTPCTLFGYPGVSFGNGTPAAQIGQPAERDSTVPPAVVTLAPGGFAYSLLRVSDVLNFPTATCNPATATSLLVFPPNNTTQLTLPFATKVCGSNVVFAGVRAVQPGTGG